MHFEEIDITPDFAQALLDASAEIQQRTLVRRRVELFAHDMRNGNFRLTHQPIAIDPDGHVIDGQHRLSAVVLSGATVRMLVASDADASTFGVIDTGRARTPSDALKIRGLGNVNVKASAARLVLTYHAVKGTTASFTNAAKEITSSDVQALFDTERGRLVEESEALAFRVASALGRYGLRSWTMALYVIVCESDVGESTRAEFFERLTDGALLAPGSPILALRRYLINDTGLMMTRPADRPAYYLANTIKTLNDYMSQRERTTISFRMGREAMPVIDVPDPKLLELSAEERERALRAANEKRRYQQRKTKAGTR